MMLATTKPVLRPIFQKPARLSLLAGYELKWAVQAAVRDAVRNAAVSLAAAAIAARSPKGRV